MNFRFDVTQEDITNGKRGTTTKCFLALTAKRMFPNAFGVRVSPHEDCQTLDGPYWTVWVDSYRGHLSFSVPKDIAGKITVWDRGGELQPFSFEVEI